MKVINRQRSQMNAREFVFLCVIWKKTELDFE